MPLWQGFLRLHMLAELDTLLQGLENHWSNNHIYFLVNKSMRKQNSPLYMICEKMKSIKLLDNMGSMLALG